MQGGTWHWIAKPLMLLFAIAVWIGLRLLWVLFVWAVGRVLTLLLDEPKAGGRAR